jgi:hypothetical protein
VGINHSLNHGPHKVVETRCSMFDELGLNHPVDLVNVPLVQSDKYRLLVREVLVDRADAYPGHFGNSVGCDR